MELDSMWVGTRVWLISRELLSYTNMSIKIAFLSPLIDSIYRQK